MRRSGRRANTPLGISLFPFLAVLLCTMGSLIVLLICLVERAGVSSPAPEAVAANVEISPEELASLANAADDAGFIAEQLNQKKDEYSRALAAMRDEMGITERLLRDQEDKTKLLQAQLASVRNGGASKDTLEAAKEYSKQVKSEIAELEASLQKKTTEQKNKPKRMSIIPYKGRNGTTQRSIYVECLPDKVVIQPEGIEFTDDDFIALKSAGNPLDASLRAVREHFAKRKGNERGADAPYPLFIVRPGGDIAFLKARMAIVSWEDEFGYELIDDTVELDYAAPDSQLAEVLRRAASDARQRQEALARALPGQFRGTGGGSSGASTYGGSSSATPDGGGSPISGMGMGTAGANKTSGRFASSTGSRVKNAGLEPSVGGPDSRYLDGVAPKTAEERARFSMNEPGKEGTDPSKEGGQKGEGQKDDGKPIRHGAKQYGDKDGVPGGKGGAPPPLEIQKRGKNWANKEADSPETAVARSINVRCSGHAIVFLPPKGTLGKPIAIEWNGDPVTVVDSIALQVRNRIKSWGMAIGGGHWQPVLDVDVAPDGEQRFADLASFFDQSGIEVRRKKR